MQTRGFEAGSLSALQGDRKRTAWAQRRSMGVPELPELLWIIEGGEPHGVVQHEGQFVGTHARAIKVPRLWRRTSTVLRSHPRSGERQ